MHYYPFNPFWLRWLLFTIYLGAFFALPLSILWGQMGFLISLLLTVGLLILLRYQAPQKILRRLRAKPLSISESPLIHALVIEHARRLGISTPRIFWIPSKAPNLGSFAFSSREQYLLITEGLPSQVSRNELSALIARAMVRLWYPGLATESWLSQVLVVLDHPMLRPLSKHQAYSLRSFFWQAVLCPLFVFPLWALRLNQTQEGMDLNAAKISRLPRELSEGLRKIVSSRERNSFECPLDTLHFFVVAPQPRNPMVQLFFSDSPWTERIRSMERIAGI